MKTQRIRQQNPLGAYDSTYTAYDNPTSIPTVSSTGPTFTATMRLGDNSATAGGTTELILNGSSGQIAWGTDNNGNLDTNAIYDGGVPFTLIIPSSTSPQTPAFLTVGDAPTVTYSAAPSYGAIVSCLIETEVNIGGGATPQDCVSISLSGTSITFSNGLAPTSNASNFTDPSAMEGTNCDGSGENFYALLAEPCTTGGYTAVSLTVTGYLYMISTDSFYQNAGKNLSFGSIWCKIYVYTNEPPGNLVKREQTSRRRHR